MRSRTVNIRFTPESGNGVNEMRWETFVLLSLLWDKSKYYIKYISGTD